ncbi:transporter substrate-binding domain-containing protein [Saccharopolyspora phatthalungensis]|uniref:Polar amino acid transport system substrate-binding protein n=1 Tax=Saccharopolyspora phatthalungensis TaxID=664693 RepID=A0A840Q889_9PSEU|nr:transporter substrate-binding domain-containing protein [Saccharopolyspora phatthalungensis]MBB5156944.1 polar amino acid transport system substrate-binding protein [Saccharopolyspora phatthalungensis]
MKRKLAMAGLTAVLLMATAACGSSGSSGSSAAPADTSAPLYSSVPEKFRDGITVSLQTNQPPLSFQKDGQTVGEDPELLAELSKVLGIHIKVEPAAFESMLLGLDQGKYDFVLQTDITAARAAKYTQLSQFKDGYTFLATKDNPDIGSSESDLCGLTIGTQSGANYTAYLQKLSTKCTSEGKGAIVLVALPDVPSLYLAAASGRIKALSAPVSTLGYFIQSDQDKVGKEWKLTGPTYLQSKVGWTFPKNSELAPAVEKALNKMIADGSYQKILTKWGLQGNIADKAELNPSVN